MFYKFKPEQSGVYHLWTTTASSATAPLIYVRTFEDNENSRFIAEFNDDMRPTKFVLKNGSYTYLNEDGYVYLEEGLTYY